MSSQGCSLIATTMNTKAPASVVVVDRYPVNDYLRFSIMNMILCCLPIAIAALVFSCKTRNSLKKGNLAAAERSSKIAYVLNMCAMSLGVFIIFVCFCYFVPHS